MPRWVHSAGSSIEVFGRTILPLDGATARSSCRTISWLPITNPLIARGLPTDEQQRSLIIEIYGRCGPHGRPGVWLPIIPLCEESVRNDFGPVVRYRMPAAKLGQIVDQIAVRMRAVLQNLVHQLPFGWLRFFLMPGCYIIPWFAKGPLRKALRKGLGDSVAEA